MAGHSKWANIKHKKAAQDAKRGQLFTKLSRLITLAAKEGGSPDPQVNYKLRLAIDQAKKANMPQANITKAIERAFKVGGQTVENLVLEAFGPGGVGLIIQAVTDNRRRLISQVKSLLSRYQASLGQSGSVSHLFQRVMEVKLDKNLTESQLLQLTDQGLIDFKLEDSLIWLYFNPDDASKAITYLGSLGYKPDQVQLSYLPQVRVELTYDKQTLIKELVKALGQLGDVYRVFTNIS